MNTELRKEIKKAFIDRDTSPAVLARGLGVTRQAFYLVIAGKTRSRRIRESIARALDMNPREIWPDYEA